MSEEKTTQELIHDYYRKDKVRSVLSIILALYAVVLATVGIYMVVHRLNQTHDQIQCIAKFFTQSDRQNLTIPSVDQCSIIKVK